MRRNHTEPHHPRSEDTGRIIAHTLSQVVGINIVDICINCIHIFASKAIDHCLQYIIRSKEIVRIKNTNNIASSHRKALVHSVVDAFVGFADIAHLPLKTRFVLTDDIEGCILRGSIDNNVLEVLEGLTEDALHRVTKGALRIVGRCYDG